MAETLPRPTDTMGRLVTMPECTTRNGLPGHEELTIAASALGVGHLVDTDLDPAQPLRLVQLAAAVSGRAETFALLHSSAVATGGEPVDPAAVVESVAFAAAGMRGADPIVTREFWSLWTLRRLQSQIRTTQDDADSRRLAAVGALLDAVHALLSAEIYRAGSDTEGSERSEDHAMAKVDGALGLLGAASDRES